jgi:hypothetical protein
VLLLLGAFCFGSLTTAGAAVTHAYDAPTIVRFDMYRVAFAAAGQAQLSDGQEGSASPDVEGRGTSMTPSLTLVATNTATSRTFGVADRVAGQLDDVRLGSLRGQLGPGDLQRLVNEPGAQRYHDTATGNINVIQQVDD